ncbi:MAG: hypothetical protein OXN89_13845 [Bryobacterales bacterium]|nr:hypothetical protein [Bryobacterales bacterium]
MLSELFCRAARASYTILVLAASGSAAEVARGTLAAPTDGEPLRLLTEAGSLSLDLDEGLEATMRDPQLRERTWEVRGRRAEDGQFLVEKIFTVKDGVLHRVTYYCVICHITTHEPGLCMCCQGDTDLRELPGE